MYKIKPKSVIIPKEFRFVADMLCDLMADETLRSATIFLGKLREPIKKRVKITRVRGRDADFVITIGCPCWREREYLKLCKKAKCNPRRWKTWNFKKV